MNTVIKGRKGEDEAVKFLRSRGYKILGRNYRFKRGEVDVIVWDKRNKELVFVEVKARRSEKFGQPEEAVDENKIRKIQVAMEDYLRRKNFDGVWRVDCVAIKYFGDKVEIKQIENIG